jgi:hypothetical protein
VKEGEGVAPTDSDAVTLLDDVIDDVLIAVLELDGVPVSVGVRVGVIERVAVSDGVPERVTVLEELTEGSVGATKPNGCPATS